MTVGNILLSINILGNVFLVNISRIGLLLCGRDLLSWQGAGEIDAYPKQALTLGILSLSSFPKSPHLPDRKDTDQPPPRQ